MSANFYLLLELDFDPPVEDQATIDQRIEEKRKFWSRNSNDFKRGIEYKTYLEKLPEIKEVMSDPIKRKKQVEEAQKIIYYPLDTDIDLLGKNGEITEEALLKLSSTKKVSVEIIKKRVTARGIKIGKNKINFQDYYEKYYQNKPKNTVIYDNIMVYLEPFNTDNFYDFLCPYAKQNKNKLSCDKLKEIAQEKKKREFIKNDTNSSSGKKVCEACELAFKDENSKKLYDEYLVWFKTKTILDHARDIAKMVDGELSNEQGDHFIGQLNELLNDRTFAGNIFISFCKVERIIYNPNLTKNYEKQSDTLKSKIKDEQRKEKEKEDLWNKNQGRNLFEHLLGEKQNDSKDRINIRRLIYRDWKLEIIFDDPKKIKDKLTIKAGNKILFNRFLTSEEIENNSLEIDYLEKKYFPKGEDKIIFSIKGQKIQS